MRFEFYHSGLDNIPKLSVDGTVGNSIHFSHWQGNETPAEVKADTSTEIALNLMASPNRDALTQGIELITNNHFDTDGILSVWTMLNGERAPELRDQLIPAAEAGDFSEFTNDNAIRASIAIQGSDQPVTADDAGSPLAHQLAGGPVDGDARAYELVLPEVERLLTRTDEYENLWRGPWQQIATAIDSFERGASTVQEINEAKLSLITIAREVFGPTGFDPARHAAPFTAISHYAKGQLFLIAIPYQTGWAYRIDYPYYSWAETIVRPRIERRNFALLVSSLNQLETGSAGRWNSDTSELSSAVKFTGRDGKLSASVLQPDRVADSIRSESEAREAAAG
ncbi:MAG: hypothetical protein H0U60_09040 [Blastocatellia bacterium]|nr:hypothetical protein [Blastocatellia bacterium]